MPKTYYYKLIRDCVPQVMDEKGVAYELRALDDAQFRASLLAKVLEEALELQAATSHEERVREYGDLCDVLDAVRDHFGMHDDELATSRAAQLAKKGGFRNRVYLVWSEER